MLKARGLKIIFLIVSVMLVLTCLSFPTGAADDNLPERGGLYVSDQSLERGNSYDNTVVVTVISPPQNENGGEGLPENADSIQISFEYDKEIFEPMTDRILINNGGYSLDYFRYGTVQVDGKTLFRLVASDGHFNEQTMEGAIPIAGKRFYFTIPLRVKDNTRLYNATKNSDGTYTTSLSLYEHSISHTLNPQIPTHEEMWGDYADADINKSFNINISGVPPFSSDGGITVTRDNVVLTDGESLDRGDELQLKLTIPELGWDAIKDTTTGATVKVYYDANVFTATPTSPLTTGSDANGSYLSVVVTDKMLDTEQNFYSKLTVRNDAPEKDSVEVKLVSTLYDGVNNDASQAIWDPTKREISFYSTGLPYIGGGLEVSSARIKRNSDLLTVTVTVPPVNAKVSIADINVKFDSSAFEVKTWSPSIPGVTGATVTSTNGVLRYYVNCGADMIDLSSGLVFTGQLKGKSTADLTTYPFTLEASFAKSTTTAWEPEETSRTVELYDDASTAGGITASPTSVKPGETVTVTITVPQISTKADSLLIAAGYDATAFELTSFDCPIYGTIINSPGVFGIDATNTGSKINLSSGATLTAKFTVLGEATKGARSFTLSDYSIEYKNTAGDYVPLWNPSHKSANVNITIDASMIFPVSGGGISVLSSSVKPGGSFTAKVTVPKISAKAESVFLRVEFDPAIFEVTSWSPKIENVYASYGDGYFSLDVTGASVDLTNGLSFTATMKAKSDVSVGNYTLKLSKDDNWIQGYGTYDKSGTLKDLWTPTATSANISVSNTTPSQGSTTFPVKLGGISLTRTQANPGDTFMVYISIPAIEAYADYASIAVEYNASAFELVSWNPLITGCVPTSGRGYFGLDLSSSNNSIDLRSGITLYATMKATGYASSGKYPFTLSKYDLMDKSQNLVLWRPSTTTEYMTLTSSGSTTNNSNNNNNYYPWNPFYPNNNYNNNTGNNGNSGNSGGSNSTVSPGVRQEDDDEEIIDLDDSGTQYYNDDARAVNLTGKPELDLDSALSGVNNKKVTADTKYKFFDGDTIIIIRNTDDADRAAVYALDALDMPNNLHYAFDISVFDKSTGKYIKSLPSGGYIDFSIPIPDSLRNGSGDIVVYHTENGYPEYISSNIVTVDGVKKITFRANSFSPYMFVDPVTTKYSGNTSNNNGSGSYSGNTGNYSGGSSNYSGGGSSGGSSRPSGNVANPGTGVALALIPAALGGCVFLAKRDKKRKRSSRR